MYIPPCLFILGFFVLFATNPEYNKGTTQTDIAIGKARRGYRAISHKYTLIALRT